MAAMAAIVATAAMAALAAAAAILAGALGWAGFAGGRQGESPGAVGRAEPASVSSATMAMAAAAGYGLGPLAPLRAALASGGDRAEIARRLAMPPAPLSSQSAGDRRLRDVQTLWRAQYLLQEGDLTGAETLLRGFPEISVPPLTDLLRARLAFKRVQKVETGWLYEKALRHGLDDDGLRLESAFAEALTDEGERAEADFKRMVEMGSRLSEPWYDAVQVAAGEGRMEEAEALLRHAWQLEPVPRANLFASPLLAAIVARPTVFPLFKLGIPEEARLAPEGVRRPLALPAALLAKIHAATCGQSLRLGVGSAVLLVPGGAELAPFDAVLEDADSWNHSGDARALAAVPAIRAIRATTAAGGALEPRLLRLAERAGRALDDQQRWNELVGLTEPVAEGGGGAPASLVRLRAKALHRLGRDGEARQLLLNLAKSDIASRRPAAATLSDLAELFAADDDFDTAIKLIDKADAQLPEPRGQRRRRQLIMDRDLASSYASFRSEHFEVRYPPDRGKKWYARQVAWVLEEERQRLEHWIPRAPRKPGTGGIREPGGKRIEVHLFPAADFYTNFGGDVAVVGLFDGKMRVPFAEQRNLQPPLVAILSHELAHALIAEATHDLAPHWVQEGVAQHIEMGTRRVNPFPDLAGTGHALSFPTLEPILSGFAEEQLVGLAYNEAAWTINFLETRFGDRAIPRLLAAFAAGRTTDQALREACGLTPAELDRALWTWGTGVAPRARTLEARRYDQEYDDLETRQKLAASPRLGVRAAEPVLARPVVVDEATRRMSDWHAVYAVRTAGILRGLQPILEAYVETAGTVRFSTAAACGDLTLEVERVLADPAAWSSPDGEVNRSLREAYTQIGDLGNACRRGHDSEARALVARVGTALDEATQRLATYGLIP
jgi:tetratricopeptide (TPR) repeat protein